MAVEEALGRLAERANPVFAAWEASIPQGMRLGLALYESGELRRLRETGASAAEVVDRLAERVKFLSGELPPT